MMDQPNHSDRPARRTALIAQELSRYNVDIAALSETRLADEGSVSENSGGYTFFWKGYRPEERRIHGVGLAIRNTLLKACPDNPIGISARLMKLRIPLTNNRHITLFSCYAPTLQSDEEDKDVFYSCLDEEIRRVRSSDKILILGDFNARVGRNNIPWPNIMGSHGLGNLNPNGHRLLTLCAQNELFITNTAFQMKDIHKGTWTHPRSKHCHMIDYCITRQRDRQDVTITRAMRGAECWTDHYLLRSKLALRIRPPIRRQPPKKKLNCASLQNEEIRTQLADATAEAMSASLPPGINDGWRKFSENLMTAAKEVLGYSTRKNKDWFDSNLENVQTLLANKHKALAAHLANPTSSRLREQWKQARSTAQQALRSMENQWWLKLSEQIQGYADAGDLHNFYDALKRVYGPTDKSLAPVRERDGIRLLTSKQDIMKRWKEHYSTLLNTRNPSTPSCIESIPQLPTKIQLSEPPTLQEVSSAIKNLKNNKSPGADGVPGEVLKFGGAATLNKLHQLIMKIWDMEEVPQDWKNARIISIYKNKGDRATCGNSRGISLLAVAGKVLARVILSRLNKYIVDEVCPESQCGFRKNRGTIDMLFVARQIQEKAREQQRDLCVAFIDLSKAFDTVDRQMLWRVLSKFGCPDKFVKMIRAFHSGMSATVFVGGEESDPFEVNVGVKQGCAMAPVLFNIFLAAAHLLFNQRLDSDVGTVITYRMDGSLFNLQRLRARTKVSHVRICELQYADDCALLAHTPAALQRSVNTLKSVYTDLGLVINPDKTEIMYQWHDPPTTIPVIDLDTAPLKTTGEFIYLGGVLASSCQADSEVNRRICKASAAFARIRERVISSHSLRLATKVATYRAICLSILLYGSETITIYSRHIRLLERFHIRCIREMLGLTWRDRVTHVDMLARVGLPSIECIIAKNQLRWVGHVRRMTEERYPRIVLYGQLSTGVRPAHGPKKRYKDHIKKTMKNFGMRPEDLEADSADRSQWRAKCYQGATVFQSSWAEMRELRRARRHQVRDLPHEDQAGLVCQYPGCGRQCRSRIGLHSHMRTHRTGPEAGRHVISDIAGLP